MTTVNLSELAQKIGNEPKEVTLPNGQTRTSVIWDGPTARKAAMEIYPLSEKGDPVFIDGPTPPWFASALAHTVHPSPVILNDPKAGKIGISVLPKGEPNLAGGLSFEVTEYKDAVKIDCTIDNGTVPPIYTPEEIKDVVLPEIPAGKTVLISGRIPNYATVTIGESYAHTNKAVAYFQPQTHGYTVGITHTKDIQIGDFIPQQEIEILPEAKGIGAAIDRINAEKADKTISDKEEPEKKGEDHSDDR